MSGYERPEQAMEDAQSQALLDTPRLLEALLAEQRITNDLLRAALRRLPPEAAPAPPPSAG